MLCSVKKMQNYKNSFRKNLTIASIIKPAMIIILPKSMPIIINIKTTITPRRTSILITPSIVFLSNI